MTTLITLALCVNASGQKLDAMSRIALQQMKQDATSSIIEGNSCAKGMKTSYQRTANSETIKAVVKLQQGIDVSALTEKGFSATPLCKGFAIVQTSIDSLSILSDLDAVERISIAQHKMELMLNHANALTGVDKIHEGLGLGQEDRLGGIDDQRVFTGKGVMIGILDCGFDPNHPMFLDKDGKSRFKLIKTADGKLLTTEEEIANFTTDTQYNSHASHVAGIAAGKYEGTDFQLQGVATEADLAMGPMSLEVSNLEYLKYLGEYCKAHNQRLVVNMSFGQNVGPHDGSDLYTQALNEIIKEYDIVACMSAGNQANLQIVQKKKLTEEDKEMKCIYNTTASINYIGQYITTSTSSPIDMDIVIVKARTGEIKHSYPIIIKGEAQDINANDEYMNGHIYIAEENIHDNLKGYIIKSDEAKAVMSGCRIGYIIKGEKGQLVTCYNSSACPFYMNVKGWADNITSEGTILNETCGTETIIVGAYISNEKATFMQSGEKSIYSNYKTAYGCSLNDVLASSSFGTTYRGEALPHICAPGAYIESAANRYEIGNTSLSRILSKGNSEIPFCYKMGTSMSSPYMAGVAALWLEANPKLTHQEIKEIAMQTAINDEACNEGNHYINEGRQAGAGKIDAYAGLKYILGENEATLVKTPEEKTFLIRRTSGKSYEVFQAGASAVTATLYNMEGKVITSAQTTGPTTTITIPNGSKGIYILRVSSNKGIHTQKLAIQ